MNLYNRICRVNALMSFNDNFRLLLHFDAAVAFFLLHLSCYYCAIYIEQNILIRWMDG